MNSKQKILIVDDNLLNSQHCVLTLEEVDAEIITAVSGEDAVTIAQKESIDLLLMDVNLPGMNGFEAVKSIKADKKKQIYPGYFSLREYI